MRHTIKRMLDRYHLRFVYANDVSGMASFGNERDLDHFVESLKVNADRTGMHVHYEVLDKRTGERTGGSNIR